MDRKEKCKMIMAAVDKEITIASYQEVELSRAIMKTLAEIGRREEQENALKELALQEGKQNYIH